MSEINFPQFRQLLMETGRIPRMLNPNAQAKRDEFKQKIENGEIKTETVDVCQCGSHDLEQIAAMDRFGLPFGAYICKDCGLLVTSPRMTSDALPYYYDNYYHTLNYGHLHMHEQQALFMLGQGEKIYNIIKPHLKGKSVDVLEIGAGTGNVLKELKEAAKNDDTEIIETGTEYSSDCLAECAKNGVKAIYGDLDTMLEKDGKFDLIILSHVFEHFIGLKDELDKIKRLLRPEGLLYIEVPGLLNINNINTYNFDFLEYLIHAHMYNFCEASLRNIVEKEGFTALSINEKVEALFTMKPSADDQTSAYSAIMEYLEKLVYCRTFLEGGIKSFRRGLNNTKEELANVHRWHDHEKEEAEKFARWNTAEKERGDTARRWLAAEKGIATELITALDEYFKTPYTSLSQKIKSYRFIKALTEKYRKRYVR